MTVPILSKQTNADINIAERVPLQAGYLKTKASKLGRMFESNFIN
ncbi:GTP cyclohydrolase-2 (fragment) [Moritella yayanosii]|uniref:GTP cyclohydrolase-2 n=1 Tax=Moritella yayanosii TaxID=69539 RepID=A0A330LQ91_9GAMM